MPKINVYDITGEKSGQITLPAEIFNEQINPPLMAQAVRVYLSNQRKARAKTKTRGQVSGSGRKIWRQKGTGRARHGDMYAPIFVGGGIAHGPRGMQNFKLKMAQKIRRKALFSALSSKFKAGEVLVIKGLSKMEPKTKKMAALLAKLDIRDNKPKVLIVLPRVLGSVRRAAENVEGIKLIQTSSLNTYEVLNSKKLVFMEEALLELRKKFLGKS